MKKTSRRRRVLLCKNIVDLTVGMHLHLKVLGEEEVC